MDFTRWFWQIFEEWRKGTTNGPTAFARYLDPSQKVIRQQSVADWLNGKYKPKSQAHIELIGEKYPDVYEVLGLDVSNGRILRWASLPREYRVRAEKALTEASNAIAASGHDPESEEARKILSDVMGKYGFVWTETSKEG